MALLGCYRSHQSSRKIAINNNEFLGDGVQQVLLEGQCMSDSNKKMIHHGTAEFLIFSGQTGEQFIETRNEGGTIWLTKKLMAALFERTVPTFNEHLQNIFKRGEIAPSSAIRKFRITASGGKSYHINCYILDAIISVGNQNKTITASCCLCRNRDAVRKQDE